MLSYVAKRIALMIPTLLGALTITFVVIQFVPGGPVEQIMADGKMIFQERVKTEMHQSVVELGTEMCKGLPVELRLDDYRNANAAGTARHGGVLLVAGDAVARAHGAGVELAAVAVVVAHLHRLGEAARGVAAGPVQRHLGRTGRLRRRRGQFRHRRDRPFPVGLDLRTRRRTG